MSETRHSGTVYSSRYSNLHEFNLLCIAESTDRRYGGVMQCVKSFCLCNGAASKIDFINFNNNNDDNV